MTSDAIAASIILYTAIGGIFIYHLIEENCWKTRAALVVGFFWPLASICWLVVGVLDILRGDVKR